MELYLSAVDLSLPSSANLTQEDVAYIALVLQECLAQQEEKGAMALNRGQVHARAVLPG
jgi:hypothetical protein